MAGHEDDAGSLRAVVVVMSANGCSIPQSDGSIPLPARRARPIVLIEDNSLVDSTSPTAQGANVVFLEVFGGPRLTRSGQAVQVTPSHLSLLILLAERGESGLTRQFASELLWPPNARTC